MIIAKNIYLFAVPVVAVAGWFGSQTLTTDTAPTPEIVPSVVSERLDQRLSKLITTDDRGRSTLSGDGEVVISLVADERDDGASEPQTFTPVAAPVDDTTAAGGNFTESDSASADTPAPLIDDEIAAPPQDTAVTAVDEPRQFALVDTETDSSGGGGDFSGGGGGSAGIIRGSSQTGGGSGGGGFAGGGSSAGGSGGGSGGGSSGGGTSGAGSDVAALSDDAGSDDTSSGGGTPTGGGGDSSGSGTATDSGSPSGSTSGTTSGATSDDGSSGPGEAAGSGTDTSASTSDPDSGSGDSSTAGDSAGGDPAIDDATARDGGGDGTPTGETAANSEPTAGGDDGAGTSDGGSSETALDEGTGTGNDGTGTSGSGDGDADDDWIEFDISQYDSYDASDVSEFILNYQEDSFPLGDGDILGGTDPIDGDVTNDGGTVGPGNSPPRPAARS